MVCVVTKENVIYVMDRKQKMKPVDAAYRQQNLFANPAWMMKQVTKT